MRWAKSGVVVPAPPPVSWAASHATLPFVEPLDAGVRLYFSSRDADGRSSTGFADFDPAAPASLRVHERPVLEPGPLGAFDDSGAMGSCLVEHEGRKHLYYIGWSRGASVPFYLFIGCAISTDGGQTFVRASAAPVVERGPDDPFLTTAPWVLVEDGHWRMWYVSGTGWEVDGDRPRYRCHIRHAESDDGVSWRRAGLVCVDFATPEEHAIGRPCVTRTGDGYRMWYSYRGDAYRIGYAESDDGLEWERRDRFAGIDASAEGWDAEMIEYPCVFEHAGRWYMLYNGNGYGATGIGLAVLEADDRHPS